MGPPPKPAPQQHTQKPQTNQPRRALRVPHVHAARRDAARLHRVQARRRRRQGRLQPLDRRQGRREPAGGAPGVPRGPPVDAAGVAAPEARHAALCIRAARAGAGGCGGALVFVGVVDGAGCAMAQPEGEGGGNTTHTHTRSLNAQKTLPTHGRHSNTSRYPSHHITSHHIIRSSSAPTRRRCSPRSPSTCASARRS